VALALAGPAAAQVPADTLALPADTLAAPAPAPLAGDTLVASPEAPPAPPRLRGRVLAPAGPQPGAALTGVPARAPAFALAPLLAEVPGTFLYDLGVPGAPSGLAWGVRAPGRLGLTLDGRPAHDLVTGRPALEGLPEGLLGPLRETPDPFGAGPGLAADLRAFGAAVPITELWYRAGPSGHQAISGTHAQTRRPGFAQRLGGDGARASGLVHVGAHSVQGFHTNAGLDGLHVVGRLGLALPGLAVEVTEHHQRRTDGAWGGVIPQEPDPFGGSAPVVDAEGQRRVIQNDLALAVRAPLLPGAEPLAATAYWTAASFRYGAGPDTTLAGVHRYGIGVEQPLAFGPHRLRLRVDGWAGRATGGDALPADAHPPEAHATLAYALTSGGFEVSAAAGVHLGPEAYPSGRAGVRWGFGPGAVWAEAGAGGVRLAPAERVGFGAALVAEPVRQPWEASIRAGLDLALGPISARIEGESTEQRAPRVLLLEADGPARFASAEGAFRHVRGTAALAFRADAARGLYAQAQATAAHLLNPTDSPLHAREAEALPPVWGSGRLGVRGRALFGGALDLDVYARGRAWAAFRGRGLHRETALFGLAPEEAPAVPASGVLDAVAEAGFGRGRASAFVAYENALAGVAYRGAYVVPVYPVLPPGLRVGLFWLLPN